MEINNALITKQARESLSGRWKTAVIACLLYLVVTSAVSSIPDIGGVLSFIISGPMALGLAMFSLLFSRNSDSPIRVLFYGFKTFFPAFLTYIVMVLFISLKFLLLIIPGIIAAFSYSQVFFVLADNPDIRPLDALKKSKVMMNGFKWKYFCLNCRFIGWSLLSLLTVGIGFLWLYPYMQISYAKFYDTIKDKQNMVGDKNISSI